MYARALRPVPLPRPSTSHPCDAPHISSALCLYVNGWQQLLQRADTYRKRLFRLFSIFSVMAAVPARATARPSPISLIEFNADAADKGAQGGAALTPSETPFSSLRLIKCLRHLSNASIKCIMCRPLYARASPGS